MKNGTFAKPMHRDRNRILFIIAFGCFASEFGACALLHPGKRSPDYESERVDSLIVLKEIISSGNFVRAADKLSPSERAPMLTPTGDVREDFKPRLRALRLRTLAEDPKVNLRRGKLVGIAGGMPVGPSDSLAVDYDFETYWYALSAPEKDSLRNLIHSAARLFFADIRSGVWQYPLNDMHPSSRSLFLGRNGKITEAAKARLSAIDTNKWEVMSLRDGKLVGVMPLLPVSPPELKIAFLAFLKAINGGEWADAMDMLVERERLYLTSPMGRVNSVYAKKLILLKRQDWDSFALQSGKLSGIVAWLDENQDPSGT